jgi:hypothetical protein
VVIPAGGGYRTHVKTVLHRASEGSYHPYVIHTAYENNGSWSYERGIYCLDLDEAMTKYNVKQP